MDAIDQREKVLTARLAAIEVEIDALIPQLGDKDNLSVVQSTVAGSSLAGTSRLTQLQTLRGETQKELWNLPIAVNLPLAIGVDAIGQPKGLNE